MGSFRRQLMVATFVLGSLVALALVAVVQVVLEDTSGNAVARVLEDRADDVTSSTDISSPGSSLVVPDADLDPGVAVYDASGALVAGTVPPSQAEAFAELSTTDSPATRTLEDAYQVQGEPFVTAAGTRGVVVLSEPLAPYENDERYALVVSVAAGALIVLLATALAGWASRRALAPVAAMAATAEEWSEHDLDRRFDLGAPTNEIRVLGRTLDALLARVAGTILAEQRLTAELAHELRSPLTAAQATADLMAMRTDLDDQLREDVADIQEACRVMAATVTGLLDLARSQSSGSTGATCELGAVLAEVRRSVPGGERIEVDVHEEVLLDLPHDLAARALSPVLENATRLAAHVRVRAEQASDRTDVVVQDDGPGLDDGVDELFVPGHSTGGGSGLGLALARRIARSVGGDVSAHPDRPGLGPTGATFVVTLPATDRASS
ncbi:MAG: HAMP domain-containing protein [Actinobacteria bacterium]|uniref:histidine kinase n=1 Tax=freshwater metagenome TaxID=449393 RepID=A0A6J6NN91_9ZZZZ|nr:HAMP domain-containing protein [Actinomycetota bacterium]